MLAQRLELRSRLYGIREVDIMEYVAPMTPMYTLPAERLRSFQGLMFYLGGTQHISRWPPSIPINAEKMADAGFFYTGKLTKMGRGLKKKQQKKKHKQA